MPGGTEGFAENRGCVPQVIVRAGSHEPCVDTRNGGAIGCKGVAGNFMGQGLTVPTTVVYLQSVALEF